LGKATPGCGSEDFYAHFGTPASVLAWRTESLELGVGVGTDFAVQINLFVPRSGPFHGKRLLTNIEDTKRITQDQIAENRRF